MSNETSNPNDSSKTDQQPEALANFAATARSPDNVSPTGGLAQTPDTAPIPVDPQLKADAAAKVLREGVLGTDEGADEAIDALPDRTRTSQA